MNIIKEHGHLTDAWAASHDQGFLPEAAEVHTPHHALREFGVTADSPLNTYTAGKKLGAIASRWQGKRLDYILYRGPARIHRRLRKYANESNDMPTLHCVTSKVVMTGKVPGQSMSLSDHFGVEANLVIRYPSPSAQVILPPAAPSVWNSNNTNGSTQTFSQDTPYADGGETETPTSVHALANVADDMAAGDAYEVDVTPETVEAMLAAIAGAYRVANARSRKHLVVFGVCVFLLGGLTVGSAWQPMQSANPILVLVAGAITWIGTTMLYSGFIWGNWERNWLMTVVEELELLNRSRVTAMNGR